MNGLTERLSRGRPVVGYTDTQTVKLDLDNVPFKTAKHWAQRVMKRFNLGGFIILKSSERHYHVVFDRTVSWAENMSIVASACLESESEPLLKWFLLQCRKKSSTLRVSPKGRKPSPRIVCRHGKQNNRILNYLRYRRRIKDLLRKMRTRAPLNSVNNRSQMNVGANGKSNSGLQVRFFNQCRCLYSLLHCFQKRMPAGGLL